MKNKIVSMLIVCIIMFTSVINVQASNVADTSFSVNLTANTYTTLNFSKMQESQYMYILSAPAEYIDIQIWSGNYNITIGNTIAIKCNEIICIDDLINENYKIYGNIASMKLRLKCNKSGTLAGVLSYDSY